MNNRRLHRDLKKVFLTMGTLLALILVVKVFSFSVSEKSEEDLNYQRYFNENYKIFSLDLPDQMSFAGEKVPLKKLDVREKLDRELLVNTYWQSHSLLFHKRANRWFPVIEPILEEEGVPEDFKYLALIESGLQNVVSPAGARGFWQFLEPTAREYGLEVSGEVDERYHVEKATRAACRYLKKAYEHYESWSLAAASFNAGRRGIDRQLERQKANNYYELLLNTETARYVYRILAVKEILEHSEHYGFHVREKDLYQPYKTYEVTVDSTIDDLAEFAFSHDISYKALKILNPWMRENYLPNPEGKQYKIKLPREEQEGFFLSASDTAQSEALDTLAGNAVDSSGQTISPDKSH